MLIFSNKYPFQTKLLATNAPLIWTYRQVVLLSGVHTWKDRGGRGAYSYRPLGEVAMPSYDQVTTTLNQAIRPWFQGLPFWLVQQF